jgi:hypothetical protein
MLRRPGADIDPIRSYAWMDPGMGSWHDSLQGGSMGYKGFKILPDPEFQLGVQFSTTSTTSELGELGGLLANK